MTYNGIVKGKHMDRDCSQRHHLAATISYDQEEFLKVVNQVGLVESDVRYSGKNC